MPWMRHSPVGRQRLDDIFERLHSLDEIRWSSKEAFNVEIQDLALMLLTFQFRDAKNFFQVLTVKQENQPDA